MLHGLYVLTDNKVIPHSAWPQRVEEIIVGGANMIQLREKLLSDDSLLIHAQTVLEVCRFYGIPLIINDRVTLAKKINADGVHIGKNDQSIQAARQYLGNQFIIGVSCYRNLYSAIRAQTIGADYAAFGSIFSSTTKPHASRCTFATLTKAKKLLHIPVCAIGGIEAQNISMVIDSDVDMVAIGHSIFNARHPRQAAMKIAQSYIIRPASRL